jgi:hypothetical protein
MMAPSSNETLCRQGDLKKESSRMIDTYAVSHKLLDVEFVLPHADTMADAALQGGLEFCREKLRLKNTDAAVKFLSRGDRQTYAYFEYGLARRLAEQVGELDNEVRAVYLYDADATAEDIIFSEAAPTTIHLIVHAQRKTEALISLLKALEQALAASYAERLELPAVTPLVDMLVVDDAELAQGAGYAVLLTSLHLPAMPVWRR